MKILTNRREYFTFFIQLLLLRNETFWRLGYHSFTKQNDKNIRKEKKKTEFILAKGFAVILPLFSVFFFRSSNFRNLICMQQISAKYIYFTPILFLFSSFLYRILQQHIFTAIFALVMPLYFKRCKSMLVIKKKKKNRNSWAKKFSFWKTFTDILFNFSI